MRKQPQQARSRLMVESLVDATALVIAEHGLAEATTGRIADVAGISIGSLYQYFDNKEQLYDAVLSRMVHELIALVDQQMVSLGDAPLRAWVEQLLYATWQYLEANNGLYLKIVRNWPQLDFMRGMDELEQKLLSVLSLYAVQQAPNINTTDLPARLYILINSVLFTMVRYLSKPSPLVNRQSIIQGFADLVEKSLLITPNADQITAAKN